MELNRKKMYNTRMKSSINKTLFLAALLLLAPAFAFAKKSAEDKISYDGLYPPKVIELSLDNALYMVSKAYAFPMIQLPFSISEIEEGVSSFEDETFYYEAERSKRKIDVLVFEQESYKFKGRFFLEFDEKNIYVAFSTNQFTGYEVAVSKSSPMAITVIERSGKKHLSLGIHLAYGMGTEFARSCIIPCTGLDEQVRIQTCWDYDTVRGQIKNTLFAE